MIYLFICYRSVAFLATRFSRLDRAARRSVACIVDLVPDINIIVRRIV